MRILEVLNTAGPEPSLFQASTLLSSQEQRWQIVYLMYSKVLYINNTTPISVCRSELSVSVIAILDHWKALDLMKGKFRRLGSTAFNSIWCCLLLLVFALIHARFFALYCLCGLGKFE